MLGSPRHDSSFSIEKRLYYVESLFCLDLKVLISVVSMDATIASANSSNNGNCAGCKEPLISSGVPTISILLNLSVKYSTMRFIAPDAQEWLPTMDTLWLLKFNACNSCKKLSIVKYKPKL